MLRYLVTQCNLIVSLHIHPSCIVKRWMSVNWPIILTFFLEIKCNEIVAAPTREDIQSADTTATGIHQIHTAFALHVMSN